MTQSMWLATPDRGLVCAAYGPCRVTAMVADGKRVRITEETGYPFDGKIKFTVTTRGQVTFPLYLRIPKWCKDASVSVNGVSQAADSGTMACISRSWENGDSVGFCVKDPNPDGVERE